MYVYIYIYIYIYIHDNSIKYIYSKYINFVCQCSMSKYIYKKKTFIIRFLPNLRRLNKINIYIYMIYILYKYTYIYIYIYIHM